MIGLISRSAMHNILRKMFTNFGSFSVLMYDVTQPGINQWSKIIFTTSVTVLICSFHPLLRSNLSWSLYMDWRFQLLAMGPTCRAQYLVLLLPTGTIVVFVFVLTMRGLDNRSDFDKHSCTLQYTSVAKANVFSLYYIFLALRVSRKYIGIWPV